MDLNKLKTFYTLARTRNYSKCAEKLFVTQSAVSHAIKALETSVGMALTEKRKNGFALTPEGQVLFQGCRAIFAEVEKTKARIRDTRNIPETIHLGATVEFGINVVIPQLATFLDDHPMIHIDFTLSHHLLRGLLDDELDIIVDCSPHNRPELVSVPLLREEYAVIASKDYIRRYRIKDVADLERCRALSLDKEMAWWRNFVNALPANAQVRFGRIMKINHIRGIIKACLASAGVGFVPRYAVLDHLETGRLVSLFDDIGVLADQICIYMKQRAAGRPSMEALVSRLQHLRFQ
ncbi:MAG: LysR family transcriptional regulator [Desulfobacter sp.]